MLTMVDEIYDRHYQEGRQALHDGLDKLLTGAGQSLLKGFEVLQRIQFAAPWAAKPKASKRIGCA